MAAGQTVLTYNGVRIKNCHTRRFDEEDVYEESGADVLFHKFTVRVVGYVYGPSRQSQAAVKTTPESGSGSAAAHHKSVRYLLLQPRKDFELKLGADAAGLGGTVLLAAKGASISTGQDVSEVDVNNGPKPLHLEVSHFAADELLRVEFEIEISVLQCDADGKATGNGSGVLSNRWSVVDEIDQNFYTTRTWSGRLRAATSIKNPNEFRHLVIAPLQDGMQRQSMSYKVTTDGLALEYTIVDKEVAWSAPEPATSWSWRHTESYGTDALTQFGDVNITLGGDRNVDKKKLISIASQILNAVLLKNAGGVFQGQLERRLMSLAITDSYGNDQNNSIHLYARVQRLAEGNEQVGENELERRIDLSLASLGKPIDGAVIAGYDNNKSRGGRDGDELETEGPIPMVSAFHTYLQTSCSTRHAFSDAVQSGESSNPTTLSTPSVEAREVDSLEDNPPGYFSESHKSAVYEYWRMDSEYSGNAMKVALPIASSPSTSEDTLSQDTVAVVTLARGMTTRRVKVIGERMGRYPQLPTAHEVFVDSNGITHTLLEKYQFPQTPRRGGDGAQVFSINAEYLYAMSRPPQNQERLPVGSNPWENTGLYFTESDTFVGDSIGGESQGTQV